MGKLVTLDAGSLGDFEVHTKRIEQLVAMGLVEELGGEYRLTVKSEDPRCELVVALLDLQGYEL